MARLIVTHAFEGDLDALEAAGTAAHLDAVDAAVVLLEELAGNLSVLSNLFRPGMRHDHDPLFEVKRFEQAWRNGFNVLTLMASPNSPTRGHPKFPQAAHSDYDPSAWMAKRAAASLSL